MRCRPNTGGSGGEAGPSPRRLARRRRTRRAHRSAAGPHLTERGDRAGSRSHPVCALVPRGTRYGLPQPVELAIVRIPRSHKSAGHTNDPLVAGNCDNCHPRCSHGNFAITVMTPEKIMNAVHTLERAGGCLLSPANGDWSIPNTEGEVPDYIRKVRSRLVTVEIHPWGERGRATSR